MRNRGRISNAQNDSDNSESESAESDDTVDMNRTANNRAQPKRRCGRPPASKNKRQRIQNSSEEDDEPSTPGGSDDENTSADAQNSRSRVTNASQNGNGEEESEEDSDSESPDSDYGPVNDRSHRAKKKPVPKKRKLPPRASKSPQKYTFNTTASRSTSVNGHSSAAPDRGASTSRTLNGSHLNKSQNRVSRPSQSYDVSLDTDLVESLAQKVVYFLLIEDQKKYAIRRKVIIAHVFKDSVYTPKLYTAVIIKANIILKKVYGMELMELENQKDCYLIVNILRRELGIHDYVELPDPKRQQHGLITFILTVIFMNDNVITEQELTKCLKPLGVDLTSKKLHPVFGDVKKLITTELVKQMYLNYECISKEPPRYEYSWGIRAKQEFDKRDLLQFVCQIIDDTTPEDWRLQFKDAENSAKPNVDS